MLYKFFKEIKEECELKAKGIKKLTKEIHDEVIRNSREFVKKQRNGEKELNNKWHTIELKYTYAKENLATSRKNYLDSHKKFEDSIEHCLTSTENRKIALERRVKLTKGLYKLYLKVKDVEKKYRETYHDTQELKAVYANNCKGHIKLQRELEKEFIEKTKNYIKLYFTKSIQESSERKKRLEEMEKTIDSKISIPKEVENEETKEVNTKKNDVVFSYAKAKFPKLYEEFNNVKADSKLLINIDALEIAKSDKSNIEDKSNASTILLTNCWYAKKIQAADIEEFKKSIQTKEGMKEFCEALKVWRVRGNTEITENGYELVGDLLILALDEASKKESIEVAMSILILSQTYYKSVKKGVKEFLQRYIQKHTIWTKDFWENVIKKRIETKKEVQKEEREIKEIDMEIYGILGAIATSMLDFDMDPNEVKELIMQYGKIYMQDKELLLKLEVRV